MKLTHLGRYELKMLGGKNTHVFLPWVSEKVRLRLSMLDTFEKANFSLGKLGAVAASVPQAQAVLAMHLRKEVASSIKFDGGRMSLMEILTVEATGKADSPTRADGEGIRLLTALKNELHNIDMGSRPAMGMIGDLHRQLSGEPAGRLMAKDFRQDRACFDGIPPGFELTPPEYISGCLNKLNSFLQDADKRAPALLKAGLAHAAIELIQSFPRYNGRIARALAVLILRAHSPAGPMLCPSRFFFAHRDRYRHLLSNIIQAGEWEDWLEFFAEAIAVEAERVAEMIIRLKTVVETEEKTIQALGRVAGSTLMVHCALLKYPIATTMSLGDATRLVPSTVNKALTHLRQLGIVSELTARRRLRLFRHDKFMKILAE